MSGIIDNLFGVLPVVFAIIWVMRIVSRRKTSREKTSREKTGNKTAESPTKSAGQKIRTGRMKQAEGTITNRFHRLEEKLRLSAGSVQPSLKKAAKVVKVEKSKVITHPVSADTQGKRLVEKYDRPELYENDDRKPFSERFKELSPLAQGMIWSVILDEPLSLKEPKL